MTRLYITPKRIVWVSDESCFDGKELLLHQGSGQPELGKRGMCAMTTASTDTASILLDYGREIHGSLKLVFGTSIPWGFSKLRIRFGESVSEACSEHKDGERVKGFSTNDHAMRDFVLTVANDGQIETSCTGFRFVRIDLLTEKTIHLEEATAVMRYRDIPYLGSFHCSDSRLDDIWMTGAYTVHLNMQDYLWDGIKRDRLVWVGDMHPEISTILSVFGDHNVIRRTIDLACQQYPVPQWLNGMSAYSMWYLIIQHELYMYSGDKSYLDSHRDYIIGLIEHIDECVEEDGSEHLAQSRFLDWPSTPNEDGVEAGYRALLVWALADGAKICRTLDDEQHAVLCEGMIAKLNRKIKSHNNLKQAASLMAIAGLMNPVDACREVVSPGGAKGFSTFYGFYMLQALALAGEYTQAIDIISEYWGAMLDLGATTFWEDFNIDWAANAAPLDDFTPDGKDDIHRDFGDYCYPSYRHSLCHGWASGPTAWLTRHVLGIEVVEPGCSVVRITPHLGSLEWAEGTFPTPQGIIYVKHVRGADGKVVSEIKAPEGVRILRN